MQRDTLPERYHYTEQNIEPIDGVKYTVPWMFELHDDGTMVYVGDFKHFSDTPGGTAQVGLMRDEHTHGLVMYIPRTIYYEWKPETYPRGGEPILRIVEVD